MQVTAFTSSSPFSTERRASRRFERSRRQLLVLFVLAGRVASSQAQTVQPALSPKSTSTGPTALAASPPADVPANYLLNAYDLVEVKVFQEDDMDWTVRVTKDGTVNLPLVGSINVLRKTPDALGEIVRARLHDGYLVHPQVSVKVLEFSKRRFTILGEVVKAGQIDFPDNSELTVLDAIGIAGGYTKSANPSRIYIKRKVGSKEIVLTVDANRMARRELAPFKVLPGDVITVGQTIF